MTATTRFCAVAALLALASSIAVVADTRRGSQLFADRCAICHSINGKGGADGPDLGERSWRDYTPFHLASLMWNHAPKMWRAMAQRNVPRPSLDERDTEDLFAYLYSVRHPDKPGDAGRGQQVFEKACANCHGLTGAQSAAEWEPFSDPVPLMNGMWNRAAQMQTAVTQRGVRWPALTAQNLIDLCAYLHRLPKTSLA
ncbi:MAG: c-type cytochrome, partial [Bryobacteraceae bacterium]